MTDRPEGLELITDLDAWALPLIEDEAAYTGDQEVIELAGRLALKLRYGIDLEDKDAKNN